MGSLLPFTSPDLKALFPVWELVGWEDRDNKYGCWHGILYVFLHRFYLLMTPTIWQCTIWLSLSSSPTHNPNSYSYIKKKCWVLIKFLFLEFFFFFKSNSWFWFSDVLVIFMGKSRVHIWIPRSIIKWTQICFWNLYS